MPLTTVLSQLPGKGAVHTLVRLCINWERFSEVFLLGNRRNLVTCARSYNSSIAD
jgi:hypothetical protein